MTPFVKLLPAILALSLCAPAAAQQLFKCKDTAGRITYASKECSELGLTSAGEIRDRSSVAPALKVPEVRRAAPAAAKVEAPPSGASEVAPAAPARRCFTVKTEKGSVVRCNDVPE